MCFSGAFPLLLPGNGLGEAFLFLKQDLIVAADLIIQAAEHLLHLGDAVGQVLRSSSKIAMRAGTVCRPRANRRTYSIRLSMGMPALRMHLIKFTQLQLASS